MLTDIYYVALAVAARRIVDFAPQLAPIPQRAPVIGAAVAFMSALKEYEREAERRERPRPKVVE